MATYVYPLPCFPNHSVDYSNLVKEVNEAGITSQLKEVIVVKSLQSIDQCKLRFAKPLNENERIRLNNVIANHQNVTLLPFKNEKTLWDHLQE